MNISLREIQKISNFSGRADVLNRPLQGRLFEICQFQFGDSVRAVAVEAATALGLWFSWGYLLIGFYQVSSAACFT
jgi:hypothetical protein